MEVNPMKVTCVFCNEQCCPAPTTMGWVRAGSYDKGLHFDCAKRVLKIEEIISHDETVRLTKLIDTNLYYIWNGSSGVSKSFQNWAESFIKENNLKIEL
jgi:hypothetical protein